MPGKQSTLIIAIVLLLTQLLFGQSNNPCIPLGEDWCRDAPLINTCQLNGWHGDTDPPGVTYTPGDIEDGWCNGDYTIENNQWLSFIAQETRLELEVDISSCTNNRGIQIACYELGNANECPGPLLGCIGAQSGQNTSFIFNVQGLTVGEQYLLMIDGFAGDGCPFTLWLDAGATQEVIAVATTNPICPGVPSSFSLSGAGSSFGGNYFIGWETEDGNIISGQNTLYPLIDQPGTYTLTIYDLTTCCWATTTVTVPEASEFPEAFASSNDLDCNNTTATLSAIGSSSDNNEYDYEYYWFDEREVFLGLGEELEDLEEAGTYTLIVYNLVTGCTTETSVEVEIDTLPPNATPVANGVIGCGDDRVSLEANASSNNVDYYWTGPLDFNATTRNPNVEEPGIYSLIVTGSNGCTQLFNVEVGTDTIPPDLIAQTDLITCFNEEVELFASSSDINVNFEWIYPDGAISNGSNVITDLAGLYTVIAIGENGCTSEVQILVDEDITSPEIEASPNGLLNCEIQSVLVESNTLDPNLNYSWIGPNGFSSMEQNIEIQIPGEYSLTVQGENGCETTIPVLVEEDNDPPEIGAEVDGELNCLTFEVSLNGSSNDENNTFEWYTDNMLIASEDSLFVSEPGEYTLVVVGVNGCTSEDVITVTEDLSEPLVDAGPEALLTCEADEVMLDGSASEQQVGYIYEWFNSGGVSLGSDLEISVQNAGVYNLVITNTVNGCTAEDVVLVNADEDLPLADSGEPGVLTCVENNFLLDASNSSSGDNILLEWYDEDGNFISNNELLTIQDAGVYNLIVSNTENGCTAESQVLVIEDTALPIADAGPPQLLNCLVEEVLLDASTSSGQGTLQYVWTNEQGEIVSNDALFNTNDTGTYTLLVTDQSNGCTDTSEQLVDEDTEEPIANAGEDFMITCLETEALISAAQSLGNNLVYLWLDENQNIVSDQEFFTTEIPGNYFLTILNTENGCEDTDEVIVSIEAEFPTIGIEQPNVLSCEVLQVLLDASSSESGSSIQYQWYDQNGQLLGEENILSIESSGTYTFVITDIESGCTAEDYVIVESDYVSPIAQAGPPMTISCDVIEVSLDGTGTSEGNEFVYEWINSNGVILGSDLNLAVSNPDNYTLIVTNTENGCTAIDEVLVVPDENIPVSMVAVSNVLNCYDQEAELSSIGTTTGSNILQQWYDDSGNPLGSDDSYVISQAGVYTLEVVDQDNGCSSSTSIEVIQDINSPTAIPGPDQILNCEIGTAVLDGSSSTFEGVEGSQELQYYWYDESGNQIGSEAILSTDLSGTYTLEVISLSNGCQSTEVVVVSSDLETPISDAGPDGLLTCEYNTYTIGGSNTSQGLDIVYEWRNDQGELVGSMETFEAIVPGSYFLTVIDQGNSCESISEVLVEQDAAFPIANAGPNVILTCFDESQIIGSAESEEGQSIRYEWLDENGVLVGEDLNLMVDVIGTYTLTVYNVENGCSAISNVNVDENVLTPEVFIAFPASLTCVEPSVVLSGGSSSVNSSFAWYDENSNLIGTGMEIEVSQSANYSLVVTNENNGCSNMGSVFVSANADIPMVDLGAVELLTCDLQTTNIDASNAVGVGPLIFEWTNEAGVFLSDEMVLEVQEPGTYTLQLFDQMNGCETSTSIIISQDIAPPVINLGPVEEINCFNPEVEVSGIGSSEGLEFSYEWTNSTGQNIGNELMFFTSSADEYNLQITNLTNGCQVEQSVFVTENLEDPLAQIEILGPLVLNCENENVLMDGSASYPFEYLLFEWYDEDGNLISENFQVEVDESGSYEMLITDQRNGCVHRSDILIEENFDLPIVEIAPPSIINCYDPIVNLDATASSQGQAFEINWSGNGLVGSSLNLAVEEAGVYTLTIVNIENGCEVNQEVEVFSDLEAPEVQAVVLGELDCVTPNVDLNGDGSSIGPAYTYHWVGAGEIINPSSLNPTVSTAGMYMLLVTNEENGCTNLAPIEVKENLNQPTDAVLDYQDITCFGFNDGQIVLNEIVGGTAPYQYSFNGGSYLDSLDYSDLGPGVYPIQVLDSIGCEWETTLEIVEPPLVYVDLGPDLEIQLGDEVDLFANSNGTYIEWESEGELDCLSNCFSQLVSPYETTTYYVEVTDENGCPDVDEIVLKVDRNRAIYIPNAFSPNNDGVNDFFTVYNNPSIKQVNYMLIADRWGEIVFEARAFIPEDPANGWHGNLRGKEMNVGVFVYYAEVEFVDGFIGKYKGDLTLLR